MPKVHLAQANIIQPKLICLDYDSTYTVDPEMWQAFIRTAKSRGHTVVCATMRTEAELWDVCPVLKSLVSIIPTSRAAKAKFLADRCLKPDIWIDDNPEWIFTDAL